MTHFLFLTIIITSWIHRTSAMDPHQRHPQINASIGFPCATVIKCKIDPTSKWVPCASQEDAQKKQALLNKFRQEMEQENNLFNNALQRFQNILLQTPAAKNNEAYFINTIEEKISEIKKSIRFLNTEANNYHKAIATGKLPTLKKRNAIETLKQKATELQTHFATIQEWEMVLSILHRYRCKNMLEEITAWEQPFLTGQESLTTRFSSLNIIKPPSSSKAGPMSLSSTESRNPNMQNFLNWLESDIKKKQKASKSMPRVIYATAPTESSTTKRFIM